VLRRLFCLIRGGHCWETITDTAGAITFCARCGKMRHPGAFVGDTFLRTHTNLGYDVEFRETEGQDALKEGRST